MDELLYVDEYPPPDRKIRVRRRLRQCGGLTGTALVAAARLGTRCAYVGRLGEDELSRFAVEALEREGISLRFSVRRGDARPGQSTIIVDETHHTRNVFSSAGGAMGADAEYPEPALIRAARALLVDHHGVGGTLRAVRIARESGVAVVADFERDPGPPFGELLELVDHLILSERFAAKWTGRGDPASAAAALWNDQRKSVVITCGAAGCRWIASPDMRAAHLPAFAVEVVDTTGCGDVFHGAYAAALASGETAERCVVFASAAAALKATQRGGQAGIPNRPAVVEFLAVRAAK